ncbi:MAG: hypothetical protein HZA62_06790 [Rhodocyclales bacterium]|nr:hypothetical protein [Rhodocyclales bacterium]
MPAVLPERFARAAQRSREAGFDGVELHYAHAYTMASFLSATNTRDDGYGGDHAERLRLPLEVFAAVRAAVGTDYPMGCRMLAEECIAGGSERPLRSQPGGHGGATPRAAATANGGWWRRQTGSEGPVHQRGQRELLAGG